jgi:hypothetical protein
VARAPSGRRRMNNALPRRPLARFDAWLAHSVEARVSMLVGAVASSTMLVAVAPRHSPEAIVLVGLSTAACGALAVFERRRPALGVRPIAAAIALVFAVAVIAPPRTSNDLWSYTMYGRTVSVHSASPYDHVPADYPSDPFSRRVSTIWQHRASVFGPAFVGFAMTGTWLAGDSVLANRLFFQLTALAAAAACLVIMWRRTRSAAALAWLGLHPAFGALAINGGHIDLLIGLGILVAAILASRQRGLTAGIVIGALALMKLTSLLALVGLVLWAWHRQKPRLACSMLLGAAVTLGLVYLPVLTSASHVLGSADRTVTPASVWNPLAEALVGHDAGRRLAHPLAPNSTLTVLFFVSLGAVACLALAIGWRAAVARRPEPAAGATTASYTMAAAYSYPWYAAWSLPTFADRQPSRLAWVVWLQASLMLAALKLPVRPSGTVLGTLTRGLLSYVAPLVLLTAFVILGLHGTPESRAAAQIDS